MHAMHPPKQQQNTKFPDMQAILGTAESETVSGVYLFIYLFSHSQNLTKHEQKVLIKL